MSNPLLGNKSNIPTFVSAEQALAALLSSVVPNAKVIVSGQPLTTTQIQALIGSHVLATQSVSAERSRLKQLIAAEQALRAQVKAIVQALRAYVDGTYGLNSPQAEQLGFAPKKRTPPSAATRTMAVEKARATREVRHTMGKNQKKALKGTVPAAPPAGTATGTSSGH
jgi:hypothetical protein